MSISGISGTTAASTIPADMNDLRDQIKQLRTQADSTTTPKSAAFTQDVHQLRSEMSTLDQAVTALKADAQGGGQPSAPGALQTVQQDMLSAQTGVQNLTTEMNGGATSPPQSGSGAGVDVIA
jgi:hypothetical protein